MVRTVAIVGAGGRLGQALCRHFSTDATVVAFARTDLDLNSAAAIQNAIEPLQCDVLINCAAQTNVDRCEAEREEAFRINAEAPRVLAEICAKKGIKLVQISTDYVFDGRKQGAYTEEDEAHPISVYGESKLEGERLVLAADPTHLVARVSWVFGPDRPSFVDAMIKRAQEAGEVKAIADKWSTPSYTKDLAQMIDAMMHRREIAGVLHLANDGACTWQEYAQWALDCCAAAGVPLQGRKVEPLRLADMATFVARRPVNTVLATDKFQRLSGITPRPWREAVEEYVREVYVR